MIDVKDRIEAALGKKAADLMIRDVNLVNVYTREVEKADISIVGDTIVRVASPDVRGDFTAEKIVDGTGKYLIPGLIDAHCHVEMSFMSPTHYAEAVLPHGTTAGIFDTHDICNVSTECMLWFCKEMAATPLKGFMTAQPCIPSTPPLENAGMSMTLPELKKCCNADGFIGIGETMDFNRVVSEEDEMMKMLNWANEQHYHIDGHCPELTGDALQAYVSAGPRTDHEFVSKEEALEKYRLGMKIVVRRGSLTEPYTAKQLTDELKDTSGLLLATDGCIYLDTIVGKGSMIQALRMVVAEGVDPLIAVQMGTINVAREYSLDRYIGGIAPGLCADMILVDDLKDFRIDSVYVNGKKLPKPGEYRLPEFHLPDSVLNTIPLKPVDNSFFDIKAPVKEGSVKVHALDVKEDVLISKDLVTSVPVENGYAVSDVENDLLKISVLHRYQPTSTHAEGFVRGFGFKKGAIAGSIGQDSQNIAVIGVSSDDMTLAVNELISRQGGVIFVADGKVQDFIPLRFGGIMNEEKTPEELLSDFQHFNAVTKKFGGAFNNPSFPLSLMLTCACIPDLKITDISLVDALAGKPIPLFVTE